ncbi:transglycosylase SLT domain-containing protein [bacterium]|nr:transglycosylase SLT domain-containing protein [candidate division CSSED10-310 bacterium]
MNEKKTVIVLILLATFLPQAYSEMDFTIPPNFSFCGEPLPLDRDDILERIDTQLRLHTRNMGQVELWFKRKHRYFPYIESVLTANNLPDDLKYIPVIESSLQNTAVSPKSAVGPWQFIASTARLYDLNVNQSIDERRDLIKSTQAALRYLKSLYDEFDHWSTAMAAYNIGENRIRQECYHQGTSDYFEMVLPYETDRYVPNIIAAKIILENPDHFGIDPIKLEAYNDPESVPVTLTFTSDFPAKVLAYLSGVSYRGFRSLNPSYIGVNIPPGTRTMTIPKSHRENLEARIEQYRKKAGDLVKFHRSPAKSVVAEEAFLRIGPGNEYPVFRKLSKGTSFKADARTATKDQGEYWYLFIQKNGAGGWIWGGQLND